MGFMGFVLVMLALDLGVFHRKPGAVHFKDAAIWSGVWISLALTFAAGVWWQFGPTRGMDFLSGYFLEKSLSVDNIFVFIVIFSAMGVPAVHQHRVLFWGILSALVLRAAMIFGGVRLLNRFEWLTYVFGAFLIGTGIKLFIDRNKEDDVGGGAMLKWLRRVIPSTNRIDNGHFLTMENGKRVATPLLMALILIELSDVVFALDSIPAVFAVTRDPFIVFTSNIFAILGLRSLFFLLAGAMDKFVYLKVGLAAVLVFVGTKMAIVDWVHIPSTVSLAVIALLLGGAIITSLIRAGREAHLAAEAKAKDEHPDPTT
jgi:tellurite resistance protein TerC